jgi:3',5'-cyclic-AMP phosphodiesterase
MKTLASRRPFQPRSPDAAGVISWVHLGDLHMTKAGEQNHEGLHSLTVSIEDEHGKGETDEVRVMRGNLAERKRVERDQDNALGAWPEHGLLGTQPNKNGKKW